MVDFSRERRDRDDPPRRGGRDDDRGSSRDRGGDDRRSRDSDRGSRDRDDDRGGRERGGRDRDDDRGGRDRDSGRRGSGSGRSFTYQARTAEETKERANKGANDFDKILKDGVKMFKPNDGDNRIRILPPTWPGAKHFGLDIYVHYGVGPDRGSYLCLQKMKQEPDPIAEEREIARRDGDEDYAKQLDAKRRVLVYLVDRDHPKEGVQAWAMPWTVDRDITAVQVDKHNGEVLPIDHPQDGYDVEFTKKGSKDRTEYNAVTIARRSSDLGNDDWLDYAMDNPLPDQLNYYTYEQIEKAFKGGGAARDSARDRGDRERDRDDRGGRDRGDDRGRDSGRDRDGGGRDRGDDRGGRSSPPARSNKPAELSWESIHEMTGPELEDVIEQERLDIDPKEAKDDADLADWVCDELKLKKTEAAPRRERADNGSSRETDDRLARMRRDRD